VLRQCADLPYVSKYHLDAVVNADRVCDKWTPIGLWGWLARRGIDPAVHEERVAEVHRSAYCLGVAAGVEPGVLADRLAPGEAARAALRTLAPGAFCRVLSEGPLQELAEAALPIVLAAVRVRSLVRAGQGALAARTGG
jgi:hypothetical protein